MGEFLQVCLNSPCCLLTAIGLLLHSMPCRPPPTFPQFLCSGMPGRLSRSSCYSSLCIPTGFELCQAAHGLCPIPGASLLPPLPPPPAPNLRQVLDQEDDSSGPGTFGKAGTPIDALSPVTVPRQGLERKNIYHPYVCVLHCLYSPQVCWQSKFNSKNTC